MLNPHLLQLPKEELRRLIQVAQELAAIVRIPAPERSCEQNARHFVILATEGIPQDEMVDEISQLAA